MGEDQEKDPDPVNFEEELIRYHEARPFVPFEIIFTSGDRVLVDDHDRLAFTANTVVWADRKLGIGIYRKNPVVGFRVNETAVW
jgi:hypothetical protein